jgi:hypothetical protein
MNAYCIQIVDITRLRIEMQSVNVVKDCGRNTDVVSSMPHSALGRHLDVQLPTDAVTS